MSKITSERYRQFLDTGVIQTLDRDNIQRVLDNIKGRHVKEGRALVIALYLTGARPVEILNIIGSDVQKEGRHVVTKVAGFKRGLPRTVYLDFKDSFAREFYEYATSLYPTIYLFYHFRSTSTREKVTAKLKSGKVKTYFKHYKETSNRLRYYFKKWFSVLNAGGLPPYFLRHNRFSKLSEAGVDLESIRVLKGARSYNSVMPYLHLSTNRAKKLSNKIK